MTDLKSNLESIGLSDKEAAVYVASLELGQSVVQKIALQAGIKRAITYVVIDSLINKGLMSSLVQGKKTYFIAENPENIAHLIKKQKEQLIENEKRAVELIPELGLLFKTTGDRPVVRFFEGIEGINTIREEFLNTKCDEVFGILSVDELEKLFPDHDADMTRKRVEKGIRSKILYTRKDGPFEGATDSSLLREARHVSNEILPSTGDMTIYGNKIAISSLNGKPTGILIEQEDIATFMKGVFELAWRGAKSQ